MKTTDLNSYNIVNVCKQITVNGDKKLQNYNEADLQGKFCFNNFTINNISSLRFKEAFNLFNISNF